MKNTKICPKCESSKIIRIPGKHYGYNAGNIIKAGVFSMVMVTRFVCENCGYSEEWIENKEDIKKLKEKYL